ncbi:MAG: DUF975 family protein [Syntrophomonas sp.]|nr:DUF975 family protein [Syntrophomonas sp.]
MWTRKIIKTRAKAILRLSYWKAFLVSLVLALVGGTSGNSINWRFGSEQSKSISGNYSDSASNLLPYIPFIIGAIILIVILVFAFRVFLGYPLEVGGRRYFIRSAQNDFDMNNLGFAFEKSKYFDIIKSMLWRAFINFLWLLLLIIPGIIKYYAYRMVPYILADNPQIGYKRALKLSTGMTDGEKFSIFVLDLSFIGWYLLGALAFGVGVLFVFPYQNATEAELYLVLRQNAIQNGLCTSEELLMNISS